MCVCEGGVLSWQWVCVRRVACMGGGQQRRQLVRMEAPVLTTSTKQLQREKLSYIPSAGLSYIHSAGQTTCCHKLAKHACRLSLHRAEQQSNLANNFAHTRSAEGEG
jgi:hypothetical protein